jgi:Mg/Co/Ni transporter MgtE
MAYTIQRDSEDYTKIVVGEKAPLLERDKDEDQNIFSRVCGFFFSDSSDAYVDVLLQANFLLRAIKFFPALLITFGIELGNSAVLGNNQTVLNDHFTLVLFIPVISAIAGNIGLQTSSSVTAYINIRNDKKQVVQTAYLLRKYTSHCAIQVALLGVMMGIIAAFWVRDDPCHLPYGLVILCGAVTNMLIASVAGVFTPILLNKFGYDPSSGAGPFETALQDVIGALFFVEFAKGVISSSWASNQGCFLYPNHSSHA